MLLPLIWSAGLLGTVAAMRFEGTKPARERCPGHTQMARSPMQRQEAWDELAPGLALPPELRDEGLLMDGRRLCNAHATWSSESSAARLASAFPVYPINQSMFERAEFLGDWTFLRHFLATLGKNQSAMRINIVGGSFSFGVGVGQADAWPSRLARHLESWGNVTVTNRARRGCDTAEWLHDEFTWERLRFDTPDLIILELAVNDQFYGGVKPIQDLYPVFQQLLERLLSLPGPPALLFVEAFRTADHLAGELEFYCPTGPANSTSRQERLKVNGSDTGYCWCSHWWEVASVHQEVLRNYSVPYFSYRDLVWPNLTSPPEDLELFWNGESHPDYVAHQLLADGVAHMLASASSMLCEEGLPPPARLTSPTSTAAMARLGFCGGHLSAHLDFVSGFPVIGVEMVPKRRLVEYPQDAAKSTRKNYTVPEVTAGKWQFREDRWGKPGWEIDLSRQELANHTDEDLHLGFAVTAGPSGLLTIDYLTSYNGMGAVSIWLDDDRSSNQKIQGFSRQCYSVSTSTTLRVAPGPHTLHVQLLPREDAVRPSDRFDILPGNKFKLLSITAC